ncbi:MAG: M1 family aminopeptidase [Bacteroidetes bacterium]|nr:M1 family aminopeptidase [Bacteroidota bacterium]
MRRKNFVFILFLWIAISGHPQNNNPDVARILISDTLDAVHYSIYLNIVDLPSQNLIGYTEVSIIPKYDNINDIQLELLQLAIDSVIVNGFQVNNYTYSDPLINIPLPEPANTGDTIKVRIRYHGIPFHEGWGGFHWAGQYCFNLGVGFELISHNLGKAWFPCIDDFHDRATYDYYITVEEDKTAVCGGILMSVTTNGDNTKTFHWQMRNTIPAYLASVAVGHYDLITDTYNGIRSNIPINFYVRPSDSIHVYGSFINLKEILAIFEEHFGPYPWPQVGYVSTALGAMEHAANIAYPYGCINGGLTYEYLYAHEISHMWFGDKVTCASAEDMWLNEGWGTFCEMFYLEDLYSYEDYIENVNTMHKEVLQYCHTPQGDGQYFALYGIPPEYTYGMTAYKKGGIILHTLRGYLGDSLFFNVSKGFLEEYAYNYMSSFDLRDYINSHTSVDVTDFFDAWVFSPGFPHYSVDSFTVSPVGNNYDVRVYARQKSKGGCILANSNKIDITFMDSQWNVFTGTLNFSGLTGNQVFPVPFEPKIVMVDVEDEICDATTDDEMVIKNSGEFDFSDTFFKLNVVSINDSAYIRVSHNWVAPDSLKNPVNGLKLSDYRYWKIEGICEPGINATGIFQYNRNNYLDNTLIVNSEDSVVILYRENAGHDWQSIDFTQMGIWSIGYLYVPNLQMGEYTLAVWDHSVGTIELKPADKSFMKIYPNPTYNQITIEFLKLQQGSILIFNNEGKTLDSIPISPWQQKLNWHVNNLPNGTYFIQFKNLNNEILSTEKVIVLK